MEREKGCNEKSLAVRFFVQFKGACHTCDESGHKSGLPMCPENQMTDGNKTPYNGNSKSGLNERRYSNTKCWDFGMFGCKRSDCPDRIR